MRPALYFPRRAACLLLAGLAAAAWAQPAERKRLQVVTTSLPPLVIENEAARPGALYELVRELGARMDTQLSIEFLPWPRAIFTASTRSGTVIFPLTRVSVREQQFRWLVPLYDENYVFLTPKGSRFDVNRPADMKHMRIAVIRGAAQIGALRERGYGRIVEANSVDEVHRFMLSGMADAAFGERAIVRSALASRSHADRFLISRPAYSNTAWVAGSPDFTERDVAAFTRAMQQMRADGTYQKILASYGIE